MKLLLGGGISILLIGTIAFGSVSNFFGAFNSFSGFARECSDRVDNDGDGYIDLNGCDCDGNGRIETGLGAETALRNSLCEAEPGSDVAGYTAWCNGKEAGVWYDADPDCEGRFDDSEGSELVDKVILVVADSLRADHLSCYDYVRETSPNIDEFASEGALFSWSISQARWTLESFTSFLSSLHPITHRVSSGDSPPLDDCWETLPEVLSDNGFKTVAFSNGPPFNSPDYQGDIFDEFYSDDEIDEGELNDEITDWLGDNSDESFFMMIHYASPHSPYDAPEPYGDMYLGDEHYLADIYPDAPEVCEDSEWGEDGCIGSAIAEDGILDIDHYVAEYDAEVTYLDSEFQNLLDELEGLGIKDDTLIILTADHGEVFAKHNIYLEHDWFYDDTLHVPLIMRHPEFIDPIVIDPQVQSIDIMPTVLEAAGIEGPDTMQGNSLWLLFNGKSKNDTNVFSNESDWVASVRNDNWKLIKEIYTGAVELFNLNNDPHELSDVSDTNPGVVAALEAEIQDYVDSYSELVCVADDPCSDGLYNEGEEGLDCGGDCSDECVFDEKSGGLEADEIWSGNIYVDGVVSVPEGVTLTIEPGTVVKFRYDRDYKTFDRGGLQVVGGDILAEGTSDEQIWFTSAAEDPINGDWNGITIEDSADSIFDYVIVEYGELGIEQFDSSVPITNSIIRWSNSEGLYAERSDPYFGSNLLYGNGYHEIALEQYNNAVTVDNIFQDGHRALHNQETDNYIAGNCFLDEEKDEITADQESVLEVVNNYFSFFEEDAVSFDHTVEINDDYLTVNNFGGDSFSCSEFDFNDVKNFELGYVPGDDEDEFPYVYDEEDETRRVLNMLGEGLYFGWSLEYVGGYLYRFSLGNGETGDLLDFIKIDPDTGEYELFANDDIMNARGLTHDGEYFYVNDFSLLKIFKFTLEEDSDEITIVDSFDIPDAELGGTRGLTTDGDYLYLRSRDGDYLYQMTMDGEVVGELDIHGTSIVWTGEYFWVTDGCGKGICKYTSDGELVGEIYPPAKDAWAITWDGEYLWTLQRTCEEWDDPKIYQIEVLDDSLDEDVDEDEDCYFDSQFECVSYEIFEDYFTFEIENIGDDFIIDTINQYFMGEGSDMSDCDPLEDLNLEIGSSDDAEIIFPCEVLAEYVGETLDMWIQIVGDGGTIDGRIVFDGS